MSESITIICVASVYGAVLVWIAAAVCGSSPSCRHLPTKPPTRQLETDKMRKYPHYPVNQAVSEGVSVGDREVGERIERWRGSVCERERERESDRGRRRRTGYYYYYYKA